MCVCVYVSKAKAIKKYMYRGKYASIKGIASKIKYASIQRNYFRFFSKNTHQIISRIIYQIDYYCDHTRLF